MDTRTDLRAMDLAAMDAAARDMGIVPGDTAYAFFMGMRRMLQEQHALLDKAAELAAGSVSAQAARELPMAIRLATFREHRTVAIVSAAVAVGAADRGIRCRLLFPRRPTARRRRFGRTTGMPRPTGRRHDLFHSGLVEAAADEWEVVLPWIS